MFNYVWGGIVIISFLFASISDVSDLAKDRYGNGRPLSVEVQPDAVRGDNAVRLVIPAERFAQHFGVERTTPVELLATILPSERGSQLAITGPLPEPLATMRSHLDENNEKLLASTTSKTPAADGTVSLNFKPVYFVKLGAMTRAAIGFAQTAFEIALKLVGGLCLWLGLLKIAEDAGLVNLLVRVVRPILRPIFPDVPTDHPALAYIALGVASNMLALGNAATPIGIKAMQELQTLNPKKDTASNAMVMLLAVNTAGVTLLPPPTMMSLLGLRINDLLPPIWLTTGCSLVIAIVTAILLGKLPAFRVSNPNELSGEGDR